MDLFDLQAKITLDTSEYEQGLNNAEDTAEKKGSSIGSKIAGAAKVIGAGISAVAGATALVTKSAVDSYASYEQLVGGVQKLYGNMGQSVEEYAKSQGKSVDAVKGEWQKLEDAQNLVLQNAQEAYKTAGMNMNDYMETATSFSAALINSLGGDTKKAAEQTDVAMRAISDNVNTFGSDMESVQNAFQGFAKQNYTMLDNLKLGYGGTKEGMEQLIKDANEYGKSVGKASDLSIDSFSDIVTAIELVQEKQGIAGTTAREAASTIEGSLNMTKAAWQNMLTALGTGDAEYLDKTVKNLTESIIGYTDETGEHVNGVLDNLIPAVQRVFEALPNAIGPLADKMQEELPKLLDTIIPVFVDLVGSIGEMFVGIVPSLVETIVTNLPALIDAAVLMIVTLVEGLGEAMPELVPAAVDAVLTIVQGLLDNIPMLIEASVTLIVGLAEGLINALPILLEMAPQIIESLVSALIGESEMLVSAAIQIILVLVDGILDNLPTVIKAAIEIVTSIVGGIIKSFPQIVKAAGSLIRTFTQTLGSFKWGDIGKNIIQGIANGLSNAKKILVNAVKDAAGGALKAIKALLGIHSPSTVFRDQVGKNMALGIAEGFEDNMPDLGASLAFDYNIPEYESSYKVDMPENTVDANTRLYSMLNEFFPVLLDAIAEQKEISIDGRKVINYVDSELGKKYSQKARGN